MTHQEIREQNKNKILKRALASFVDHGIEKTKIKDVATSVGLTERSAFRYFPTKVDLVLAAAIYFWENTLAESHQTWERIAQENKPVFEEIETILITYADVFLQRKKELVFIQEAELYLYRLNKLEALSNQTISFYKDENGPLSKAIRRGIAEDKIVDDPNIAIFYLNCFDGLLGLLQKLSTSVYNTHLTDFQQKERLTYFCHTLVKALQ